MGGHLADFATLSKGFDPEQGGRQRFHNPGCHLNSLALGHTDYACRTLFAKGYGSDNTHGPCSVTAIVSS